MQQALVEELLALRRDVHVHVHVRVHVHVHVHEHDVTTTYSICIYAHREGAARHERAVVEYDVHVAHLLGLRGRG